MPASERIARKLENAVAVAAGPSCPPSLRGALRHAVFSGGARVRPRLCLAVSHACGDCDPSLSDAAAAAIELLHCASLVHDDLPCFDDAEMRRGAPSVHKAYGEPIALLAGDALIVLAFQVLGGEVRQSPLRAAAVLDIVAEAVGGPDGIVAGQAWECEPAAELETYQRAKTGSLFVAAAMAGAAACGADPDRWRLVGERLGEAYQVADDLRDALLDAGELGKDAKQDARHDRPNAVAAHGVDRAFAKLNGLVAAAIDAVPACPNDGALRSLIESEAKRLTPRELALFAA